MRSVIFLQYKTLTFIFVAILIYIEMYIKELIMQVFKWGNSLAIRLPAAVFSALD